MRTGTGMHTLPYVLLVDGKPLTGEMLADTLAQYRVVYTPYARAARAMLADDPPDIMLVNLILPDADGIDLLAEARALYPDIPVIILAAVATVERVIRALRHGAFDFIQQPASPEVLRASVKRALDHSRHRESESAVRAQLEAQNAELKAASQRVNASEQGMRLVGRMVRGLMREIANPLSVIRVNTSLLEMTASLDNGNHKRLRAIQEALESIQATINAVQTFAFASSDPALVDPADLVQKLVDEMVNTGEIGTCRVRVDTSSSLPPVVTRPAQIRQVLRSLLINADRATAATRHPESAIVVAADRQGDDLCLTIRNERPLGPPNEFDTAFDLLVDADVDTDRLQGVGLGLFMARHVVEANGGQLVLNNDPGQGTTISMNFPLNGTGPLHNHAG